MESLKAFNPPKSRKCGDFEIRCYRDGDAPALKRTVEASYDHLRPWMPWVKTDQPLADYEQTVLRFQGSFLLKRDFPLGIWEGEELAGGTGFHLRDGALADGVGEIGMWIASQKAGTGFGTRVLSTMLDWGFEEWPWRVMIWRCNTNNLASARVAAKNGLTFEGTQRQQSFDVEGKPADLRLFSILRSEWEARRG